jgi:ribosomal protein L14
MKTFHHVKYSNVIKNIINVRFSPLQKVLSNQTNERKKEILKAVTEAAKKYANENTGIIKFDNKAILIVGKK